MLFLCDLKPCPASSRCETCAPTSYRGKFVIAMDFDTLKSALPLLSMLFGAGVTWGVAKASASTQAQTVQKAVENFNSELVKLRDLVTDFRLLRAEQTATGASVEKIDSRLTRLEHDVIKLTVSRTRSRRIKP